MPSPSSLRERLLGKIVMPGPATPCATWVGAYNQSRGFKKGHQGRYVMSRRPVIWTGGSFGTVVYAAPVLLKIAGIAQPSEEHTEACHTCPTGTPPDGVYRCVDLEHLRWGTRQDNERDKRSSTTGAEESAAHADRDDQETHE